MEAAARFFCQLLFQRSKMNVQSYFLSKHAEEVIEVLYSGMTFQFQGAAWRWQIMWITAHLQKFRKASTNILYCHLDLKSFDFLDPGADSRIADLINIVRHLPPVIVNPLRVLWNKNFHGKWFVSSVPLQCLMSFWSFHKEMHGKKRLKCPLLAEVSHYTTTLVLHLTAWPHVGILMTSKRIMLPYRIVSPQVFCSTNWRVCIVKLCQKEKPITPTRVIAAHFLSRINLHLEELAKANYLHSTSPPLTACNPSSHLLLTYISLHPHSYAFF